MTMRLGLRTVVGVALVGVCLMVSSATAIAVRSSRRPAAGARVRSGPSSARGVLLPAPASAKPRYQPGVVLVGLRPGVASSVLPALTRGVSARGQRSLGFVGSATRAARRLQRRVGASFLLRVPSGTVLTAVAWLRRQRRFVRYAEPNYVLEPAAATRVPNDPSFGLQWGSLNTGQSVKGVSGTPGADDHAAQAWTHSTGSRSIVIGEVDTGVDYNHPDLAANIWSNPGGIGGCPAGTHGYNVLSSSCDPMDTDVSFNGHGTHVAGIMGAVGNNATGVAGMNWSTTILPVRWVSDDNAANTTSNLISALNWLLQAKQAGVNVRVINDSTVFIGTAYSQALSDEIDALGANNILFVTAAGNTGQNDDDPRYVRYPCAYDRPTEICVTATNQTDQLPSYANYGPNTVDLGAPGDNIYSTLRNGTYGYISGSSMASAQVSGAAALILSAQNFSPTALKADILNTVDPLSSLAGLVRTGGRLDVCAALPGCEFGVFTYPTNGQTNVDTTKPFTWSTAPAAQGYYLTVGTTKGGYDVVNSGPIPASQSSYNVPAMPAGQTLYATLYTELNGNYNNYQQITFTAAAQGGSSPMVAMSARVKARSALGWLPPAASRARSRPVPGWLRSASRARSRPVPGWLRSASRAHSRPVPGWLRSASRARSESVPRWLFRGTW
ncbi:MAG: S8 family peptidase [Solirubrobacteraceae bacterium]